MTEKQEVYCNGNRRDIETDLSNADLGMSVQHGDLGKSGGECQDEE